MPQKPKNWLEDLSPIAPRKGSKFELGNRFATGRKKGKSNKITREIRESAIQGFAAHGADGLGTGGLIGFFFYLASCEPQAASRFAARMLPREIIDERNEPYVTAINIIGVPRGKFFTAEEVAEKFPAVTGEYSTGADGRP